MSAQFVDRGKPHHAFGHLRLDRAIRIQRIGHAVDDARFEHRHRRLILVRRGRRMPLRCGHAGAGSANVDGARPLRRCGSASAIRERSGCGQASSNVAGGASAGLGGGGADRRGPRTNRPADGSAVAPRRARVPSATTRKQQVAPRLGGGLGGRLGRRHGANAIARGGLLLPWAGGGAGRRRGRTLSRRLCQVRLVEAEQRSRSFSAALCGRRAGSCRDCRARLRPELQRRAAGRCSSAPERPSKGRA